MRMYKVFKCEDYTFEWAGGCTIKVHWDALDSNGDTLVDVIEFYETFTDKDNLLTRFPVFVLCP